MIEHIIQFDKNLFYFINKSISNPVFDFFMPIITNGKVWLPIYLCLFFYLIFFNHVSNIKRSGIKKPFSNYFTNLIRYNKKGFIVALMLAIAVVLADQISANLIKDLVGRARPCQELNDINLLVNCGSGKSFPSSHSTNNFAAAVILSYFYKNKAYLFFTLATLVALSRVFVGVHYPIDIFFGAILGWLISMSLIYIYKKFISKRFDDK